MLAGFGVPQTIADMLADTDVGITRGELDNRSGELHRLIGRATTPLAKVVASAEPAAWTVDPLTNAEPKAVRVVSPTPATTELGEMLVRTGVGLSTVKIDRADVPPPGAGLATGKAKPAGITPATM